MSTTQAPALPEPQAAMDTIFQRVHSQVFFGKLAQAGIPVNSEKDASDLLELAGKLRAVAPQIKQAQVGTYAAANATLDQALAAHGLDSGIKRAQANDQQIALGNVAAQLAQDPEIYNAVLSIKSAEASQIAEQLAAAK